MRSLIAKRSFFWNTKKEAPKLISQDEEMLLMRYRGQIDDFLSNRKKFERYMVGEPELESGSVEIESKELIPGRCTPEGTARFK